MMVRLAKAGRRVVRLKSGDPTIFGRAGEEIAVLEGAGISYDVVPGITAGLALAARLGVSLTHRDQARSVRFVTGHSKEGGLPRDVDWAAIADPSATTIFYMGGRMAGQIADRLVAEGLSPDMPVAVAAELGRSDERILSGDLANLAEMADAMAPGVPVLIGIGAVFRKRAQLRWTRTAGISPCGRTSSTAMTPESTSCWADTCDSAAVTCARAASSWPHAATKAWRTIARAESRSMRRWPSVSLYWRTRAAASPPW